jgi:carotenoid cleavage dioxygenase
MDPSYVFHVLNAFDEGDRTVLDLIRYDAVFDTAPGEAISRSTPVLSRWTVDPAANRVHEEVLDDTPVEFPRIDPAVAGARQRYGYCVRTGSVPGQPSFEGLVKYDFARDESVRYDPGEGRSPGEPVFVRAADGDGEDEGWVLTVVYDAGSGTSDLVILDATSFGGPPVATVHLPARVPFGFHGSWLPSSS